VKSATRRRLRQLAWITLVVCSITPIFNMLTDKPSLRSAFQGAFDGMLVTLLVGGYLLFLRDGRFRPWFRRMNFLTDLVVSSAIVIGLFLVGRAIGLMVLSLSPRRFLTSFSDPHLAYGLPYFAIVVVLVQFVLQMNRIIGTNVLRYFIAGVYHRPRAEERIFLFVDLAGSTQLAERLGSARYFELLRRFVDDLSEPVLASRGAIYQYAGDEVVITWPIGVGTRAAACVRCFFGIRAAVGARAAHYEAEFGVVPRFRGGLHGGMVTAGELGDLRQEIVFVGDILNTAARLEEYAKRAGLELVVSGALLDRLTLPPDIEAARCGELELRGKDAPVTAYSLRSAPVLE
jgi:adenylate cyclase